MFNDRKDKISREEWIKEAMTAADEATRAEEARYKAEREVKRRQKLRRIIIRVLALFLIVLLLTMIVQAFSKEPMTRFFFNHWGMFVLVSAILILLSIAVSKTIDFLYPEGRYPKRHIEKSRPESVEIISKIAWIVFVATPILLGIIVNSSFVSAWSWWTIESIHPPNVSDHVSPLTGSFSQGDIIDLQFEITNESETPITELSITFPKSFSDSFVVDYLNASYTVVYGYDTENVGARVVQWAVNAPPELVDIFLTGKEISTSINITKGQMFKLTIPIQLSGYGNFSGELNVKVGATGIYIVTPIGPYGRDPKVTNYTDENFSLNWTVLQRTP